MASILGSEPSSQISWSQRHAAAHLAAHVCASSREGTSITVSPPTVTCGPSLIVPSADTMLAFWGSSPLPHTHTPASMASWLTACAALSMSGMSSSRKWSIAWASRISTYCGIARLLPDRLPSRRPTRSTNGNPAIRQSTALICRAACGTARANTEPSDSEVRPAALTYGSTHGGRRLGTQCAQLVGHRVVVGGTGWGVLVHDREADGCPASDHARVGPLAGGRRDVHSLLRRVRRPLWREGGLPASPCARNGKPGLVPHSSRRCDAPALHHGLPGRPQLPRSGHPGTITRLRRGGPG